MIIEERHINLKPESESAMMTFSGRRLKMCMKIKSYTPPELHLAMAKKCENNTLRPSTAMIYSWLNDKGSPKFEYVPILLELLEVEFGDLCEWRAA